MSSHFARSKQLIIIKNQQLTFYYLFDNQQINNLLAVFSQTVTCISIILSIFANDY